MSKDEKHAEEMEKASDFDPMGDGEQVMDDDVVDKEMWRLDRDQENLLDDVNGTSIFYIDFPSLPDFPCMSSSSSSSSLPAPTKLISTTSSCSSASSSSAASWAVLKTELEEETEKDGYQHYQVGNPAMEMEVLLHPGALSSTPSMDVQASEGGSGNFDCINVMENFGYMDLLDNNDIWDPSSVFQSENPQDYQEEQKMSMDGLQEEDQKHQHHDDEDENNGLYFLQGNSELAVIFFEWLKQNKDHISAEDMRSIKLKRSTVESALKRLGSTDEGKKHLLKLILEWVEQYQLQRKRMRETEASQHPFQYLEPSQNPNSNPNPNTHINLNRNNSIPPPDPTACFPHTSWMAAPPPPPQYVSEPSSVMAPPGVYSSGMGYMGGDPYGAIYQPLNQPVHGIPCFPSPEFESMDSAQSWQQSQLAMPSHSVPFPDNSGLSAAAPHPQAMYGGQYPYQVFDGNGERLRLGSSATKEARKKRMARQRRLSTHHFRHHHSTSQNQNHNHNQMNDQHSNINGGNCTSSPASPGSWVYWPSSTAPPASAMAMVPPVHTSQPIAVERPAMQQQNYHRQVVPLDRRQGWKTEKNLKFLLQKVLKQSDVGNLGRIVLPKKEAEIHLPELDSRDGISLAMEDIGTSRVWNMRYRFWPNNKSRMYLLENTGEFVRANGLQEGDFIVLYSDTKCGKYLIRGVKVRQPGPKLEGKKPARRNQRNNAPSVKASSLSSPIKQAVK